MIAGNRTVAVARVALSIGVLVAWAEYVQAAATGGAQKRDKDALVPPTTIGAIPPAPAPDPSFASPPPAPVQALPPPAQTVPASVEEEVASSPAFPPAEDPGPRRPLFCISMGMGISSDHSGLVDQRTVFIPSFQAQVGVGEGIAGLELRLFSNQAAGRYHQKAAATAAGGALAADMAVDRLALDLMVALRPLAFRLGEGPGWVARVGQSLALNIGFAAESESVGPPSVRRYGPVLGGHVDLPLLRKQDATDLRVRLSGRRMFGGQARAGTVVVTDTKAEFFGSLALVF